VLCRQRLPLTAGGYIDHEAGRLFLNRDNGTLVNRLLGEKRA
jgi:hypothetical protein